MLTSSTTDRRGPEVHYSEHPQETLPVSPPTIWHCHSSWNFPMHHGDHPAGPPSRILVTDPTEEQHLATLEEVLHRLDTAGVCLKCKKCAFMLPLIEYLGHCISADGLQPTDSKIKALKQAPVPANVSQLKSFLGLLKYYGKFVPNLSTVLAPLHSLLHKQATWTWGPEQQSAFDKVRSLLTSDTVLAHYDQTKPLVLACDASPYGIGQFSLTLYPTALSD